MANLFWKNPCCAALYNFESGALTEDSVGDNTLTDVNTVGEDTSDYKQGSGCADLELDNSECLYITDANLDSGFPYRSDDTTKVMTFCAWIKPESANPDDSWIFAKYDTNSKRSIGIRYNAGGNLSIITGYNSGANYQSVSHASTLTTGQWYHVFLRISTSGYYILNIWDDNAQATLGTDISGTFGNAVSVTDAALGIGARFTGTTPTEFFDGKIDEAVFFNDWLSVDECDDIRAGTYEHGNDFSQDSNCVALYRFEDGRITTDEKGSNDLTDYNTVLGNTTTYRAGYCAADFENGNNEYLEISDANLSSDFPCKSGQSNTTFSFSCWVRPESLNFAQYIFSKWDETGYAKSYALVIEADNSVAFYQGYGAGANTDILDFGVSLVAGRWYHIGVTYDGSTNSARIRIWDDYNSTFLGTDATKTFSNSITSINSNFVIGNRDDNSSAIAYDGLIDELVVFSRLLSTSDIDAIRTGTFGDGTLISISDTGTITEVLSGIAPVLSIADAGAGNDVQSPNAALSVPDGATASDGVGLSISLAVNDDSSGADLISGLLSSATITDSANALDAIAQIIINALAITDISTGTDAISILQEAIKQVFESGSGIDAISTSGQLASLSDFGSAADQIGQIIAQLQVIADSGAGVDLVTIIADIIKHIADTATGSDAPAITFSGITISDSGVAVDLALALIAASVHDNATAADAIASIYQVYIRSVSDSGVGIEAIGPISVQVSVTDLSQASELIQAVVSNLQVSDLGSGLDLVIKFIPTEADVYIIQFTAEAKTKAFTAKVKTKAFSAKAKPFSFNI